MRTWRRRKFGDLEYRISNRGIHNLSKYNLSTDEARLLSYGRKFIPTPRPINPSSLSPFLQLYCRNVRLRFYFGTRSPDIDQKFKLRNPNYQPPPITTKPFIEKFLFNFKNIISNEYFNNFAKENRKTNLTKGEKKSLNSLLNNNKIVIKNSDKNLGITIVDSDWYYASCLSHLNNERDYRIIINEEFHDKIYPNICRNLSSLLSTYIINKNEYSQFMIKNIDNKKIPYFYIIPKIHKVPVASRPIAASQHWVLHPVSSLLAEILNPSVTETKTYLKNSKHLIGQMIKFRSPKKITYLITGDVESLYTNIPINDLITIINNILLKNKKQIEIKYNFDITTILSLLNLILYNNYVMFDDKIYLQTHGIPMGTPCAPHLANLFLSHFENEILHQMSQHTLLWKRFIDDIFIIWSGDAIQLQQFLAAYCSNAPTIKINWKITEYEAEFLDLHIIKSPCYSLPPNENNVSNYNSIGVYNSKTHLQNIKTNNTDNLFTIEHKTHQKVLNNYLYVPFKSYHRRSTLKGFIKGELLRYLLNSSKREFYDVTKLKFWNRLVTRGYPKAFIRPIFNSIDFSDRNIGTFSNLKQPSSFIPLKIPHNPSLENLNVYKLLLLAEPNSSTRRTLSQYQRLLNFKLCWLSGKHLETLFNNNMRLNKPAG